MYQTVGIFIGQGVERNIDVARSTVLMKSNKKDFVGDVLLQESCQWYLRRKGMGAHARCYQKHNTEYWEEDIFQKRKKMYPLKLLLHFFLICKVVKVLLHLKLTLLCL